jgi:hypothetical protein
MIDDTSIHIRARLSKPSLTGKQRRTLPAAPIGLMRGRPVAIEV